VRAYQRSASKNSPVQEYEIVSSCLSKGLGELNFCCQFGVNLYFAAMKSKFILRIQRGRSYLKLELYGQY